MKKTHMRILAAMSLVMASSVASAQTPTSQAELVTVENYNRAQTDVYFAGVVKNGGFGKFGHGRELALPAQQGIPRPNRDTLYSFAIADLNAGPVMITLPDAGKRYMGLQAVNQDQYTPGHLLRGGHSHPDSGDDWHTLCHCRGPLPCRFLKQGRCPASPRLAGCDQVQPGTTRRIRNSSLG